MYNIHIYMQCLRISVSNDRVVVWKTVYRQYDCMCLYASVNRSPFVQVEIDDRLPISNSGELLCSYSNNSDEFWVSLIEKAYMKVQMLIHCSTEVLTSIMTSKKLTYMYTNLWHHDPCLVGKLAIFSADLAQSHLRLFNFKTFSFSVLLCRF